MDRNIHFCRAARGKRLDCFAALAMTSLIGWDKPQANPNVCNAIPRGDVGLVIGGRNVGVRKLTPTVMVLWCHPG